MVRLDAKEHVDVRQASGAEVARLLPRPERRAKVAVEADCQAFLFRSFQTIEHEPGAAWRQRGRDAAQVQPVKVFQQGIEIDGGKVEFGNRAMLAVVRHLAWTDAVAGFQIIRSQTVRWRLFRCREQDGRAMHVVAAQHADSRLAQAVVGDDGKERAIDA